MDNKAKLFILVDETTNTPISLHGKDDMPIAKDAQSIIVLTQNDIENINTFNEALKKRN